MGMKPPGTRRRRYTVHFGMAIMLVVPLYRQFQLRNIVSSTFIARFAEIDHGTTPVSVESPAQTIPVATNTSISSSITDAFHPNNIALVDRVPCGKEKCFFQLKSNEQIGYLVSRFEDREDRKERFQTLERGWNLARSLKQDYGIQHFLLAPPKTIIIRSTLVPILNRNLWSEKKEKKWKKTKRFLKGNKAYIQKVKVAPKQTILIGCSLSKVEPFKRNVKEFMQDVVYQESFARRFQENLSQAKRVLAKEPCLVKDFQVLMDTKGRIFHLDFDRCFAPDDASIKYDEIGKNETASCLEWLDEVEREIHENLGATSTKRA